MGLGSLIFLAALAASPPITVVPPQGVRVERLQASGGVELYTYFATVADPVAPGSAGAEIPLVTILRDTLGDADPENDRVRDVWAFTYSRPSVLKRALAAVPFWYHRVGSDKSSGTPPPLIDMAAPAKGTVPRLIGTLLQSSVLDPLGLPYRATTRAYRSRSGEYRNMSLWRTLEVLSADPGPGLPEAEVEHIKGRLLLSRGPLGGLVGEAYVAPAWQRFESNSLQWRAHNWELLRQRAEENGLYFQALSEPSPQAAFAMLWMDQATAGASVQFDSRFLSISDPFRDSRVPRWSQYSETWALDANGSPAPAGDPGVRQARMIPLALYSLDHPRAPLLLLDFRDPGKPARRERLRRAADDLTSGVLGWTGFGNLPYLAAKTSWSFIHGRHGDALDRDARVRAYVQLRQAVASDQGLDAGLRNDLARRMGQLGLNPLDNATPAQQENARRQYAALMRKAASGELAAYLAAGRAHEAEAVLHSARGRAARRAASVLSLGLYRHREAQTPELLAVVDKLRRMRSNQRYLEEVLADGGTRPDVVADIERVRRSLDELNRLSAELPGNRQSTARISAAFAHIVAAEANAAGQ